MAADLGRALLRRWQGYRRLSPADRGLAWRGALLLALTTLLLKLLPMQRVVSLLARLTPRAVPPAPDARRQAEHIADLFVAVANLHPLPATCLPRAVALWWLLRRAGIDAAIVLGVQPHGGAVAAHAWVEAAGHVLGDPQRIHQAYSTILARFSMRQ